ncbi:hypothetical protein H6G97_47270 [Nostoc flagelliforme FACHB-838]|uniref:Uncharacterized protein n=1 Tax=Nostoc flagelliforme FACHB-838 TaxID=2692904 RepID=A0ABR8E420_9NOSO|nr:hypothetical protein [Nostoc flagelliforme]MBD2536477.1 hypothetical protein [Nostoc flagelliforme FACHB-838]
MPGGKQKGTGETTCTNLSSAPLPASTQQFWIGKLLAATWTLYIPAYYGWQCNDAPPYAKSDCPQPNVQYFTKVYARNLGVHLSPVKLSEQK